MKRDGICSNSAQPPQSAHGEVVFAFHLQFRKAALSASLKQHCPAIYLQVANLKMPRKSFPSRQSMANEQMISSFIIIIVEHTGPQSKAFGLPAIQSKRRLYSM